MTVGSVAVSFHALRKCGTGKAACYMGALGDFGRERRRECQSNAQGMSNASPALTINSNTAIFASIGAPDSHELVRQRLSFNTGIARLGSSLAEGHFDQWDDATSIDDSG
jgi:hypothetical protein